MTEQAVPTNLLQQFVERAGSLYSLPAVAVEVLELTGQPRVDARALKACVERDPALTGKLLRVVNSSMFGLSREVSDLNQALGAAGRQAAEAAGAGIQPAEGPVLRDRGPHAGTLLAVHAAQGRGRPGTVPGLLERAGRRGLHRRPAAGHRHLVLVQELGDSYLQFLHSVHEQQADLLAMEVEHWDSTTRR